MRYSKPLEQLLIQTIMFSLLAQMSINVNLNLKTSLTLFILCLDLFIIFNCPRPFLPIEKGIFLKV